MQYYDPLDILFMVMSQHDKESYLLQEKPFLWAQEWIYSKGW